MARIRRKIIGLIVLSMGMIGAAPAAIKMNRQDFGDQSNGTPSENVFFVMDKVNNGPVVPRGLSLTVEYMEFDLLNNEVLFEELRECDYHKRHSVGLVQQLREGAKVLKELRTVVPLSPGRTGEGMDAVGESMLRVKLTSVTQNENTYAIKVDLERQDKTNGIFDVTSSIKQQKVNLKPGTSQVATLTPFRQVVFATNKLKARTITIWVVYLSGGEAQAKKSELT